MPTDFFLVATWFLAMPVLFMLGVTAAGKRETESWKRKLSAPSQVASWVFGAYYLALWLCPPEPGGVRGGSEVLYWLWVASGPLCCFFSGLAFGITRRKRTLVLLIAVTILLGVLLFAIGLIAIIGVPAVVGPFGPEGVAAGGIGQDEVAVAKVLLVYGEYPAVLGPALVNLAVGEAVFLPCEAGAGVCQPAACAAAGALAGSAGVVLLDIARVALVVIEPSQLAPDEDYAFSKSHSSEGVFHRPSFYLCPQRRFRESREVCSRFRKAGESASPR